jgi:hypothetical protein
MKFIEYKGQQVPIQDTPGSNQFCVTVVSNEQYGREKHQFFFARNHSWWPAKKMPGWVPTTFSLPFRVEPRSYLPDGVVDTVGKLVQLHYSRATLIPHPDPTFIPEHVRNGLLNPSIPLDRKAYFLEQISDIQFSLCGSCRTPERCNLVKDCTIDRRSIQASADYALTHRRLR